MNKFSPLQILDTFEMHYRYRCNVLATQIADELGIKVWIGQPSPNEPVLNVKITPTLEPVQLTPTFEMIVDFIYYAPPVLILGLTTALSFIEFFRRVHPRN